MTRRPSTWVSSTRPFLVVVALGATLLSAACAGSSDSGGSGGAIPGGVGIVPEHHHRPWDPRSTPTSSPTAFPSGLPSSLPSSSSDPTAKPSTSPGPTAKPTAAPTFKPTAAPLGGTTGAYTLLGCKVFNGDTTAVNRIISSAPIDPNSANIISHSYAADNATFESGVVDGDEQINTANGSTPRVGWSGSLRSNSGGISSTVPWASAFVIETSSDNHAHVINTQNCSAFESYGTSFSAPSGPLDVSDGTYYANISTQGYAPEPSGGYITVAGLPMFGFMDTGDDVQAYANLPCPANSSVTCIPHPVGFYGNPDVVSSDTYVFPAGGNAAADARYPCSNANCLVAGDIIRLHASVVCPTSGAGALVCNQLKFYGGVFSDTGGCNSNYWGIRTGLDTNGNDEMSAAAPFLNSIHITDFDLIQRPALNAGRGQTQC
jgi:hypothetical protein